jgi:urea transport system permease protein
VGAVLGALLVSWGRTTVSETNPDNWLYFQGLLFVVVVAWVPGGITAVLRSARDGVVRLAGRS